LPALNSNIVVKNWYYGDEKPGINWSSSYPMAPWPIPKFDFNRVMLLVRLMAKWGSRPSQSNQNGSGLQE